MSLKRINLQRRKCLDSKTQVSCDLSLSFRCKCQRLTTPGDFPPERSNPMSIPKNLFFPERAKA
ncbi:hypothetical protein K435DRAFT_519938 [Dendrothele bispora CBS 962.96]|uniref:Uncharacterized protein n=1 Tax=Dendrothele bispora (strain CBS 962.96) TaxID=1314807 RepID=A0A4V4HGH9_DENBC|nr:hypothetical protein K435DRAFT_519938 [Dendrothele bispora CBS 962.96]